MRDAIPAATKPEIPEKKRYHRPLGLSSTYEIRCRRGDCLTLFESDRAGIFGQGRAKRRKPTLVGHSFPITRFRERQQLTSVDQLNVHKAIVEAPLAGH